MATAHVQTKDAQTASGTSLGISLTGVGGGNHLMAFTCAFGASTVVSVSPSSTPTATWNAGNVATGLSDVSGRTDYTENTASGSWTVSVKTSSTTEITGIVSESSGVATSASIGAKNQSTASATTIQAGSITPAAGSIVYACIGDNGGSTSPDTINSSYVVHSDSTAWNGANQRAGDASLDNVLNAATNPTWTNVNGTGDMAAFIIEFKAASGGGATPVEPPMRTMRGAGF